MVLVIPLISVGPLVLGESRQAIRAAFGESPFVIPQTSFNNGDTDYFKQTGLQAHYDNNGYCEAITALAVSDPHLYGVAICNLTKDEFVALLAQKNIGCEVEDDGVISRDGGISVFISDAKIGDKRTIAAVHVFRRGYYEENGV